MANYNLVIDTSNFKPMSYKDIMAPYEDYAKDYDNRKAEIDAFIDKYGNLNLPQGSIAAEKYNQYLELQNKALEDFYKYGLNATTGAALRKAFNTRRGEISLMYKASEKYEELLKRKLNLLDLGYIVSGLNDSTRALDFDSIMNGQTPLLQSLSKKDLLTGSMVYFKGLNNARMNMGEASVRYKKILDGQYYLYSRLGLDPLLAMLAAVASMPEVASLNSELLKYIRSYANSVGILNFDRVALNEIWNTIGVGLISSIEDNNKEIANLNFESNAARSDRALRQAATIAEMRDKGYAYDSKTGRFGLYDPTLDRRNAASYSLVPDYQSYILGISFSKPNKLGKRLGTDGQLWTDTLIRAAEEKAKKDHPEKVELAKLDYRDKELTPYFKPINFRLWNEDSTKISDLGTDDEYPDNKPGGLNGYSYGNNSTIKPKLLKKEVQDLVLAEVHRLDRFKDVTWDDLEIYRDYDFPSNNHYRVVIKGSGERGGYKDNLTNTSSSKPSITVTTQNLLDASEDD